VVKVFQKSRVRSTYKKEKKSRVRSIQMSDLDLLFTDYLFIYSLVIFKIRYLAACSLTEFVLIDAERHWWSP
jgi:hypothetical protein